MAIELQGFKFTAIAGEDLSAKQYHFMKISGNMTVVTCDGLGSLPCGILQNNPILGGAAEILVHGISKVVTSGAIAFGVQIGTDADGHAITVDPDGANDYYYVGIIIQSTGGGAEIGSVLMNCAKPVIQSGS
jgi:hypothetical protein